MHTETIGESDYVRFDKGDADELIGARLTGGDTTGQIRGVTNAHGEHHPAIIHVDGGRDIAAHQLPFHEFDGRHNRNRVSVVGRVADLI